MVEYNKINKTRPVRPLGRAEIDQQYRGATKVSANELDGLREEIHMLRNNIGSTPRLATDDLTIKLDEALEEISAELEQRYIDRISALEATLDDRNAHIAKLEERIDTQDALIKKLTNNIGVVPLGASPIVVDDEFERPSIDKIIIDPTKKGSENELESHVRIKETRSVGTSTFANINKLKDLMRSRP